jgi:hypothetical protein
VSFTVLVARSLAAHYETMAGSDVRGSTLGVEE